MMILIAMVFLVTGCGSYEGVETDLTSKKSIEDNSYPVEKEIDIDKSTEISDDEENEKIEAEKKEEKKEEIKEEKKEDTEVYPNWTNSNEANQQIYNNLNLDGIGDSDDSIYISTYSWGRQYDGVVVLQAKLGTGEVLIKIYDVFEIPSILIGHLQYENKDSIVVELLNRTSNYTSTKLSILEAIPAHQEGGAELVERLLLTEEADEKTNVTMFTPYPVVYGSEIVGVEGSNLQGLKVPLLNFNNREELIYVIVRWIDNMWVIGE